MRTDMVVWAALGLLLMAAETLVPGAFLLWLGLAAALVFVLVSVFEGLSLLTQVVAFVVFSFAAIGVYRRWYQWRGHAPAPLLNRRAEQLVGRETVLLEGSSGCHGRVRIDDAYWQVGGAGLIPGARVRVVGVSGMALEVVSVDSVQ